MSDDKRPRWRRLLRPKILIPVILTVAILATLLGMSDLPEVFGRIRRLSHAALATAFGLAVAYQVVKGGVLYLLLRRLGIRLGWRRLVFVFSVAEMSLPVPAGEFVENYLLKRTKTADFAYSAAATTMMLLLELIVCLALLLVFPIPHWAWVRPVAIVVLLGLLLFLGLVKRERGWLQALEARVRGDRPREVLRGVRRTFVGVDRLWRLDTVALALLLTCAYLAALADAFMVVAHGTGTGAFTFLQAAQVYALALAATLMLAGIITQLGVVEGSGLGAAQSMGYGWDPALAMLLGFRIVWMASIWLMSVPAAVMLRRFMYDTKDDAARRSGDPAPADDDA